MLQTPSPLCLHPLQQKYSFSSISTLIYPQAQHLFSLQVHVHCIIKIVAHKTICYCTKKIKRRVKTLENRKSFYKNVFACYNVIYLTFIIRISSKDQYNFNMSLYEQWYNSLTIWATSICNYMYKHKDKKYWLIIFEVQKKIVQIYHQDKHRGEECKFIEISELHVYLKRQKSFFNQSSILSLTITLKQAVIRQS